MFKPIKLFNMRLSKQNTISIEEITVKNDIKLDQFDNLDVEYYIREAKLERDAYIADLFSSLKAKLVAKLAIRLPKISIQISRPAH